MLYYIANRYALLAEVQGFSYCCRGLVGAIGDWLVLAEAQGFRYLHTYTYDVLAEAQGFSYCWQRRRGLVSPIHIIGMTCWRRRGSRAV